MCLFTWETTERLGKKTVQRKSKIRSQKRDLRTMDSVKWKRRSRLIPELWTSWARNKTKQIKTKHHFGHIHNQGTHRNGGRRAGERVPFFGDVQNRASAHGGLSQLISAHRSSTRRLSSNQWTESSVQVSMAWASVLEASYRQRQISVLLTAMATSRHRRPQNRWLQGARTEDFCAHEKSNVL